jgi:DNA-directed RNA polymerase specialized sigma24 family protein
VPHQSPTARFHTTRWSLVTRAAGAPGEARRALDELCEAYWYPLYAYLRRKGETEDDARDLVQGFLADLLERGRLGADPARGRFRSYLLGALVHHASNTRRRARADKRGGGRALESLDGEARYALEPDHGETAEALFERAWALLVIERALARLGEEYGDRGAPGTFEALRGTLAGQAPEYERVAVALGTSPGAVRVTVHRMRARLRELIRGEVAQTVADGQETEAELGLLLAALGRS